MEPSTLPHSIKVELVSELQKNNFALLLNQIELLMPNYPNSSDLFGIRAAAKSEMNQFNCAINDFNYAIGLNPNDANLYNNLGTTLLKHGDFEAASAAFKRSINLSPTLVVAHRNLGKTLLEIDKIPEAINALNDALLLEPLHPDTLNSLGNAFSKAQQYEQAILQYIRALELQPNFYEAFNNMGAAFFELSRIDDAMECYAKALEIKPDYLEAQQNMQELLKVQNTDDHTLHPLVALDAKIKSKEKLSANIATGDLLKWLYGCIDDIDKFELDLFTQYSQVFKRTDENLNCERHTRIFKNSNIIPEFCFGCYKIQVDVGSFIDLIKLCNFFYQSSFKYDRITKCIIELRPNVSGSYKGFVYSRDLLEAQNIQSFILENFGMVTKSLQVKVKRGCTEFGEKYPEYPKINFSSDNAMTYPEEWSFIEKQIDIGTLCSSKCIQASLSTMSLSDLLIIEKWIDYAKGIGDPTVSAFSNRPIKYPEIFELATARRMETSNA